MKRIGVKDSLKIDPLSDGSVFLGPKKEAVDRILEDVSRTVRSGRLPKKVVMGVFGIGKTHFIHYAMRKLIDLIYPLYVEVPPCHRRSRFTDVYNVVLRKLGKDTTINLLKEALAAKTSLLASEPELTRIIAEGIKSESLSFLLWKFLSGTKLTSSELRELGVGHPIIYEDEAVWVLNLLGEVIMKQEGKPLVIFFDEFDNIVAIQGDSFTMFTEAIRGMVDEGSRLGVFFVASGREVADYPQAILEEPVRRRIGIHNYITFTDYTKDELVAFMEDVLVYKRSLNPALDEVIDRAKTTEEINQRTFPFTRQALMQIATTIGELRTLGKLPSLRPSDALNFMNICREEWLSSSGTDFIDSNFVRNAISQHLEYLSGKKQVTV